MMKSWAGLSSPGSIVFLSSINFWLLSSGITRGFTGAYWCVRRLGLRVILKCTLKNNYVVIQSNIYIQSYFCVNHVGLDLAMNELLVTHNCQHGTILFYELSHLIFRSTLLLSLRWLINTHLLSLTITGKVTFLSDVLEITNKKGTTRSKENLETIWFSCLWYLDRSFHLVSLLKVIEPLKWMIQGDLGPAWFVLPSRVIGGSNCCWFEISNNHHCTGKMHCLAQCSLIQKGDPTSASSSTFTIRKWNQFRAKRSLGEACMCEFNWTFKSIVVDPKHFKDGDDPLRQLRPNWKSRLTANKASLRYLCLFKMYSTKSIYLVRFSRPIYTCTRHAWAF